MTVLACLSFWVPVERMDEFKIIYVKEVAPILKEHDLVEASRSERADVHGIFSRLFELASPTAVAEMEQVLRQDLAWGQALQNLGTAFGTTFAALHPDGIESYYGHIPAMTVVEMAHEMRHHFGLYTAPAGSGTTVEAGAGFRQGVWQNFGVLDGLPDSAVVDILEDRQGHLWLATEGGVSRYNGVEFVTFTEEHGLAGNEVRCLLEDREGHLWFGTQRRGVCRYDGREFATFTTADGLAHDNVFSSMEDRQGHLWFATAGGGTSRYDGREFVTFTTADGLAYDRVTSLLEDREGYIWFGTRGGGVSRYDGREFTTFTTTDGLAHNNVRHILEDREGYLWFGTVGGVSRYDGWVTSEDRAPQVRALQVRESRRDSAPSRKDSVPCLSGSASFVTFTAKDGLMGNDVRHILEERTGHLWFATYGGGVSRYDGREFTSFTTADGLAHNLVGCISEDRTGHLWFGTAGGGVSRYDGREFTSFPSVEGRAPIGLRCVAEDRVGHLWFGAGGGGVGRYDGREFTTFTTPDGLAYEGVTFIHEDRVGHLWFGLARVGVSRYDGREFVTFTTRDGLSHNRMNCILEDRAGHLWFGSNGGGVTRFDGQVFQHMTRRDGLLHDQVMQIIQDRRGDFWFATVSGPARYRPRHRPPILHLKDVTADRRYGPVGEIQLTNSQKLLTIEFQGASWTTRPDGMAYVYRLEDYETDWQTTYEQRVVYQDLPLGEYTFQIKAVDRDLNYSEPATVEVSVAPDFRIEALNEALSASGADNEFVGKSPALLQVQGQLAEVAPTGMTVFISGETGTGKGLAARTVHGLSSQNPGPFIPVNCGAIPKSLVESELFGHERGAFTGAASRKLGKVELADGGTLFLDEIGDLPLEVQAKLLRFLDEHAFERVGGTETLHPEVRIIAATNRDLRQMVEAGEFRRDLYYRLQAFPVQLPPLRQRREDIPLLAAYFMEHMATHLHKEVTDLTPEALSALQAYDWPGNVRELEHAVQRAVIVCRGTEIQAGDISLELVAAKQDPEDSGEEFATLEDFERRYIRQVLERSGWLVSGPRGAAAILGLRESTLRGRMKKLDIKRP